MAQKHETVRMSEGGRIVVPAAFRKALGINPGDSVVLELDDGELRIRSVAAGIRHAQEILAPYLKGVPSLSDELRAERRAEAANE